MNQTTMDILPEPTMTNKTSAIVIVDDHPITREGLASLIRQAGDFTVCGEAANAEEAVSMLGSVKPDLVLTDISLPGRSGIELIKDIRAMEPLLPVMVISMHEEALYAERAIRAGARGYVMKNENGEVLLGAIREVLAGKIHVSKTTSADRPPHSPTPVRVLTVSGAAGAKAIS